MSSGIPRFARCLVAGPANGSAIEGNEGDEEIPADSGDARRCGLQPANVDEEKLKEGMAKAGEVGKQLAGKAEGAFRDFLKNMKPDKEAIEAPLAATGETVIGETDKAAEPAVAPAPGAEAPQQGDAGVAPPADPAAAQAEVAAKAEQLRADKTKVILVEDYHFRKFN
ncbi:MAG: hypothetical protein FJX31_00350 [Alphaproteobacteria bacterium]|nr:hypothetical protein [Alphaproteobacteria bacterium]